MGSCETVIPDNSGPGKDPDPALVEGITGRRQFLVRAPCNGEFATAVFYPPSSNNDKPAVMVDGLRGIFLWSELYSMGGFEFVCWLSEEVEPRGSNGWKRLPLCQQALDYLSATVQENTLG